MCTTRTLVHGFLGALLVAGTATAAPTEGGKDGLFPGARLLHKFPTEVYRLPLLLPTDNGTRLLLWVDAFDPTPMSRFPMDPLPDPVFDLIGWDVAGGKEVFKLAYPKEGAPYSPLPGSMVAPGAAIPFGTLALSPDGKRLASLSTSYRMVPGKVVHEATTQIKLYDVENRKWLPPESASYKDVRPQMLFAPDAALVILKEATCSVQEMGKPKPRLTFDIVRAPSYKANPINVIGDAVVSPDGALLAVAADGMVTVYDLTTGKKVFQAARAAPEAKTTFGQVTQGVSLAFAPSPSEQKLLAVEVVTGPPKSFVVARAFDLKEKKEVAQHVLAKEETKAPAAGFNPVVPTWGRAYAYFSGKGEPRVLFDGKVIDAANGKVLHKFDPEAGLVLSRDGKCLVRLTRARKDDKKMAVEVWGLDGDK
jgi:hypothetical protein